MEIPDVCKDCWCLRTQCLSENKVIKFNKPKCIVHHDIPKRCVDEGRCSHYIKEEHVFYRGSNV